MPVPVVYLHIVKNLLSVVTLNLSLPYQDNIEVTMGKDLWGKVFTLNLTFIKPPKIISSDPQTRVQSMQNLTLIQETHYSRKGTSLSPDFG